ncbi:putative F-box protein At5g66830 [Carex rostrata]
MLKQKTKSSTTREQSSTDGALCHESSWSELPEDIIHLFSKKLLDISDFIRFRVVCKRWQLSAPVNDPPPQLPWLLKYCHDLEESTIISFYCHLSGKVHTFTCPDLCGASFIGPACRYLLAYHWRNSKMYLLNLLTRDQIHVPIVNVCGFVPDYIGPDPIVGGDIVIISGYCYKRNTNMMAFWRPKADDWDYVEVVGNGSKAYYMGHYFSNDEKTNITNVIDIATKQLAYHVAPPDDTNPLLNGCTILVESGGKILRLFQYYEGEQCHFDIYSLYFGDDKGKPCWVKITDIGNQMLFVQYNLTGLSFCASNIAGLKGNCIYFLMIKGLCLCRYDIGDSTTKVLPYPFDSVGTWFVPSLV